MALRVPWSETWVGLDIARDREARLTHVDVHAILNLLERRLAGGGGSLIALYLFGSEAEERARPDSDIDLAFLADVVLAPEVVFDTAQALASVLRRDVDLVDLATASTVLRAQVIGNGRMLHQSDLRRVAEFEMYALSDYARLNEERKPVLDAFLERYRAG
jgi:predicted nucleotidyltransferase